ncbi:MULTISPECIES: cytochrome c1 [Roseobacteraceae]|uniref:Cytochrome c1 n=1 Tax=Pseudosulfitobacter pseudonitzschiae TaxID=1402135 RepID=A0A221K469_9RHOB|nr:MULTISPECIES: cytochrome c1 [Roseobacteraceae]ASM73789.1 cytochrome c1 [Pseudosulfitobacter pseudonitzschiae]
MFKKIALGAAVAFGLAGGAYAAGGEAHVENFDFPFDGPFGTYDTNQLQRGLQIYTEVCAACHGLKFVPLRTLADEGGPSLPEDQVRAYAEQFEVFDPELDDTRPGTPVDHFPRSALENAPDLSLMAKARAGFHGPYGLGINQLLKGIGGPEYIATLLISYEDPPSCAPEDFAGYYNTAFTAGGYPEDCKDEDGGHMYPGSWIAMAPPLAGEDVEFADGHSNELHHEAQDVAAFLMWTAEPKLSQRKQAGFVGVLFLTILSVLLYLTNKRLWAPVKKKYKRKD